MQHIWASGPLPYRRAPVICTGVSPPFSSALTEIKIRTKLAVSVDVNRVLDTAVDSLCVASPALSRLGVLGSIWPQRTPTANILGAASSAINGLTLRKRFV